MLIKRQYRCDKGLFKTLILFTNMIDHINFRHFSSKQAFTMNEMIEFRNSVQLRIIVRMYN